MTVKKEETPLDSAYLQAVVEAGIYAVKQSWLSIFRNLEHDPMGAFSPCTVGKRKKKALKIDVIAQYEFEDSLHTYHNSQFANIEVWGEETLDDETLDLSGKAGIFALVDTIDGTDLLERGLYNWCSAVVFFCPSRPKGKKIIASLVALPSGKLFYASAEDETVRVKFINHRSQERYVSGVSKIEKLGDASICFYGQKAASFVEIAKYPLFHYLANGKLSEDFRMYTLAGIPMVMNLIDHQVKTGKTIDAVFDIRGQKPHDVVPGAFLALKAGAVVKNLQTGKNMTLADLEEALLRPAAADSKLKYIIASTPKLTQELSKMLKASVECEGEEQCVFSNWFNPSNKKNGSKTNLSVSLTRSRAS